MSDFFAKNNYPAVVCDTYLFKTEKTGAWGLNVAATATNAKNETEEFRGVIWFSPKCVASPGVHKDGTPKLSMAQRALNAIGFTFPLNEVKRIGVEGGISLVGNKFSAALDVDDRGDGGTLKIAFFNDVNRRPPQEAVDSFFDTLGGKGNSPSPVPASGQHRPAEDDPPPPTTPPEEEVPF